MNISIFIGSLTLAHQMGHHTKMGHSNVENPYWKNYIWLSMTWVVRNFIKNSFEIVVKNIIWFMAVHCPWPINIIDADVAWWTLCRWNLIIIWSFVRARTYQKCIGVSMARILPIWNYPKSKNLLARAKIDQAIHFSARFI